MDFTEDLKKFKIPTLLLCGDKDQIVPLKTTSLLAEKLIPGSTLKIYEGAPHGLCSTLKERVNEDILQFIEKSKVKSYARA